MGLLVPHLRETMRGSGTFWVAFLALSVLGATNCAAERPTNRLFRFGFGACNQNANSRCLSDANCTATQFCFLFRCRNRQGAGSLCFVPNMCTSGSCVNFQCTRNCELMLSRNIRM